MLGVTQVRSFRYTNALAVACMLAACLAQACAIEPETVAKPLGLIGGMPAPSDDSSVWIAHADEGASCSGALIAPTLVVTALHCTLAPRSEAALRPDGFIVGFGGARDQGEVREVARVERLGGVDGGGLAAQVDAGRDVALLWLEEVAPASARSLPVLLDYAPRARDAYYLSGFGLEAIDGTNGRQLRAPATLSGLDAATGVLQLEGAGACYGDSGGPIVLQRRDALVGVIGQVAVDLDAGACTLDLAFGYSVLNASVRSLLTAACATAGGCGDAPDTQRDEDAATAVAPPDSGPGPDQDAATIDARPPDASDAAVETEARARRRPAGGCACSNTGHGTGPTWPNLLLSVLASAAAVGWKRARPGVWQRRHATTPSLARRRAHAVPDAR
jgi:hypothetical protein